MSELLSELLEFGEQKLQMVQCHWHEDDSSRPIWWSDIKRMTSPSSPPPHAANKNIKSDKQCTANLTQTDELHKAIDRRNQTKLRYVDHPKAPSDHANDVRIGSRTYIIIAGAENALAENWHLRLRMIIVDTLNIDNSWYQRWFRNLKHVIVLHFTNYKSTPYSCNFVKKWGRTDRLLNSILFSCPKWCKD